ncbi:MULTISPECIES: GAF domain-containing protein [Actinomycetes]|uniref:GAF domain-containing protein n=1 Tax=Actinomycetes TaxID=1760 RepID=UPI000690542B|nr:MULTISPECIES: GAF domain-containing protein [Actinomycetes]
MNGTSDRGSPADGEGAVPDQSKAGSTKNVAGNTSVFTGVSQLCDTVVRLSGVDGAAIALLTRSSRVRDLVYATDATAQQIDELQFTLGEGPCLDAYHHHDTQLLPDLRDSAATGRWPVFAGEALDIGVRSVFAFPVVEGGTPLGVLELYRRTAGALAVDELNAALTIAATAAFTVRQNWDEYLARTDDSGGADAAAENLSQAQVDSPGSFSRSQVYLASGMAAVQLGIPAGEALDRLRAYSYQHGRSIKDVSDDVVARRLNLRDEADLEDT